MFSYKAKVLQPVEVDYRALSGSRRTLSQQDLRMEPAQISSQPGGNCKLGS